MKNLFRRESAGARLVHPLEPIPRTVVLAAGFESNRQIRVFPGGWCGAAQRFRPAVLAAPLQSLLKLAGSGVELTHAVIVFSYDFSSRLSDIDRDRLWEAFGVPIFEQVLSPSLELIATECEAHDGLHLVGDADGCQVDHRPCGCGSRVPRMLETERVLALSALA